MRTGKVISHPTPPASMEAEQAVLGAILVRPEILSEVRELLSSADFSQTAHGLIFKAMIDLQDAGKPVDLVTVSMTLKERGKIEAVGGPVFLAGLSEQVGFATNGVTYAQAIAKKADFRRKREIAQKIIVACDNGGRGLERLVSEIVASPKSDHKPTFKATTARELGAKEFPAPRWAIPDLIPEGLTILGGRPKIGKSWFALNLAVAAATGGMALGKIRVEKGECLYLALEDTPRRLKERLEKIIPLGPLPDTLHFITANDFPLLFKGGLDALSAWLTEHPQARLVVLDTLARVKPPRGKNADSYEHDSQVMAALQGLAALHQIALIVVAHTKKGVEDDFLANILGSSGLTGVADCVAELTRKARGQMDGILKLTGRDIEEQELAMRFDPSLGLWELLGEAAEYALTEQRQEVIQFLRENGPKTPKELADLLEKKPGNIKKLLWTMAKAQEIKSVNGRYELFKK